MSALSYIQINAGDFDTPIWLKAIPIKKELREDGQIFFQCACTEIARYSEPIRQIRIIDETGDIAAEVECDLLTAYEQGMYVTVMIDLKEIGWEVI